MSAGWRPPAGGGGAGEGVLQLGEPHPHRLHPSVQPERARGSCLSRGKQLCSLEHAGIRSPSLLIPPPRLSLHSCRHPGVSSRGCGVAGVEAGSPHLYQLTILTCEWSAPM